VAQRLGFHVVARLAGRHQIKVVLSPTPGSGVTASIALPGSLFELGPEPVSAPPAPNAARLVPPRPAGRGLERPPAAARQDGAQVRALIPAPRPPLPEEHTGAPSEVAAWPSRSWSGWWADPSTPSNGVGAPSPGPRPTVAAQVEPAPGADDGPVRPRLRRRVPQAHLAPGLRVIPNRADPEPAAPPATGEGLSRYQASRAAARAAVDDSDGAGDQQVSR
jgi:hypothetical protein